MKQSIKYDSIKTFSGTVLVSSLLFAGLLLSGCQKYLDEKSNKQLVVPSSVQDLQALLDYYLRVNNYEPALGEQCADNYYITDADYAAISTEEAKGMYSWVPQLTILRSPNEWSYLYDNVYRANTVLDNLVKVKRDEKNAGDWDNLKGQAILLRAKSFLLALGIWSPAYDATTAQSDLGIALRLNADFNQPSVRASVQQSYDQVIKDLLEAVPLLAVTSLHPMRGSKPAAFALLARTYLYMHRFDNALRYADSALQLSSQLLDYNRLNPAANFPFQPYNAEVIMESNSSSTAGFGYSIMKMDSVLYRSYDNNDLRKTLFFKNNNGSFAFKGSYEGSSIPFAGIATDEMYLTRAECLARTGNANAAMTDLNTLLVKRWKTGTFVPLVASDASQALQLILAERRKELLMRMLRWMDIKRLNKEGVGIVPKRIINGITIELPPNDARYAFPLPQSVVTLSGMPQNPR
ncbi:MAG: RagB/SusD family nutrient uptake outer membrane protein [Bacteroidota bacterium]